MILPQKSLIIDIPNILFRVCAVQKNNPYSKDSDDLVGLSFHISLYSIYKHYTRFKPDFIVFAFEGANNWRKTYTKTEKSRQGYKSGRIIDPEMKHFYKLIDAFRTTITAHTSICCLCVDTMEADDSIAAYCQLYASPEHEIIIISGDRDFTQLLSLPGVKLVNPDNGKLRNTPDDKEYEPNLDYWMFKKCIRGDSGDSVPSAFPRVKETRIKKAFEDQYERLNFMNDRWTQEVFEKDESGVEVKKEVTHRVGDLFEENTILLNLYKQPAEQRQLLEEGVKQQVETIGTYSHFHFLRFLGEYKLKKVTDDAIRFVDMFANNQKFLKGEKPKEEQKILVEQPKKIASLLEF